MPSPTSRERILHSEDAEFHRTLCGLKTKEKHRRIFREIKGALKLRDRAEPDVAVGVDLVSSLSRCTLVSVALAVWPLFLNIRFDGSVQIVPLPSKTAQI